jgi:hypothetical protein
MFRLIAIDFSQKSPHFSLLSPTPPCELSEREVTSPFNLKVVGTKTTLLQCIVKNYAKQRLAHIQGPVTVVAGLYCLIESLL